MTLMLGNRYFLDRDYARAIPLLEAAVADDPGNFGARKKLVISYLQVGELDRSLGSFEEILRQDPRIIIDTDPEEEDCPCPALCAALEKRLPWSSDPFPALVGLAVLEAYCDLPKALRYLRRAIALRPAEERLARIQRALEKEKPSCHTL